MNIQYVPREFIQQTWPQVGPLVERAMEFAGSEYGPEYVRFKLVRGEMSLLVTTEVDQVVGACVVEFIDFPNDRIGFVVAIAGRLIARQDLFEELKQWCRENGCTKIRGEAREAVARLWKQRFGIQEKCRVVETDL